MEVDNRILIVMGFVIAFAVGNMVGLAWDELFPSPDTFTHCKHFEYAKLVSYYDNPTDTSRNVSSYEFRQDIEELRDKEWDISWEETSTMKIVAYCEN